MDLHGSIEQNLGGSDPKCAPAKRSSNPRGYDSTLDGAAFPGSSRPRRRSKRPDQRSHLGTRKPACWTLAGPLSTERRHYRLLVVGTSWHLSDATRQLLLVRGLPRTVCIPPKAGIGDLAICPRTRRAELDYVETLICRRKPLISLGTSTGRPVLRSI